MKPELKPIGLIHSPHREAEGTPIQPRWAAGVEGRVEVLPEFAPGLRDLAGFERIWLLFWCDRAGEARLEVVPYRDTQSHGVFATLPRAGPILLVSPACACWRSKGRCSEWLIWTCWMAHHCSTSNPTCLISTHSRPSVLGGMPMLVVHELPMTGSQKLPKANQHEHPQSILIRQSPGQGLRELSGLPARPTTATRTRILVGKARRGQTVPILPCL